MTDIPGAQLANTLHALGVEFVLSGEETTTSLKDQPLRLISALASSAESRLRLALIPLFLQHPEFADYARAAAGTLSPPERITLQCYYSAAAWLQRKYRARLSKLLGRKSALPDLFSKDLDIAIHEDPEINLRALALRHQVLSRRKINWLGTYEHGAQKFMSHLERQN